MEPAARDKERIPDVTPRPGGYFQQPIHLIGGQLAEVFFVVFRQSLDALAPFLALEWVLADVWAWDDSYVHGVGGDGHH